MKIEINNCQVIEVEESCLTIKNGRLYNTTTKQYEGVEGDRVTFFTTTASGAQCWTSGTVDGYTCDKRVKLRGVDKIYNLAPSCTKIVEHLSRVTNTDGEEKKESEEDWDAILGA